MKRKIIDVLFILILTSISTSLLLGVRSYTLPEIERYQEVKLKTTILEAAGIDYDNDVLNEIFHEKISTVVKDGLTFYLSPDSFYIFEFKGRGLWGMINGVITLDADLETIRSIRIMSQEETPGLGSRISEESYLTKYSGKKVVPQLTMVLRKRATAVNEIDAISGASISSQALVDMVNASVINFRETLRGKR